MYVKWTGMFFLFTACTGIGWNYSREIKKRLDDLKNLYQLVTLLKGEISYGNTTLPEAFLKIHQKLPQPFEGFMLNLAEKLEKEKGKEFFGLFQESIKQKLDNSSLKKEELEGFYSLGEQLGFLDRQNQIHQLEIYEKELEHAIERYREEMPEKRKLCEKMGILCGIFLIILFL